MPILLDGKTYQIDRKVLTDLIAYTEAEYAKLDEGFRFMGKAISREVLRRMEKSVREKTGSEEKARACRPDKKADATLFLMGKLFEFIGLFLEHAELHITTTEGGQSIVGLTIESPTRGPLAADGNLGLRQDDSSEVSRSCVFATVSTDEALHFRLKA